MRKVILFGATGHLGKEIARELVQQGYDLTVVVRTVAKAKSLSHLTTKYIISELGSSDALAGMLEHQAIVISALGKSVSPNDHSKPGFREVDLDMNVKILQEAKKSKITKFIYVSAFHSEKYLHLEYFKVHHEFSELLKHSGIDYSIIKPPSIFSAYIDLMTMAKKGWLFNIGKGDKKTNPIFEGDLAKIAIAAIHQANSTIEAGGRHIYTRKQLNETVQSEVNKNKKIRTISLRLFKMALPFIKIFNRNTYDKFAFFIAVLQQDTIAPQVGEMSFEHYVKWRLPEQNRKDTY
jgi:uncharacterized protein YbjT (DUF2867 family)